MPDDKNINVPKKIEASENAAENIKPLGEKAEKIAGGAEKETQIEVSPLDRAKVLSEISAAEKAAAAPPPGGLIVGDDIKLKQRQKKIEKILEKDLAEIYAGMTPDKKREFKAAGEETARAISGLLGKAKLKIKEVVGLIKKWLLIIPGVNKFFLEQEVKIKADEVMKLNNESKK